ncbi:MAG: FAD-dependent oxidoreductase [Pseudomonadota bacterium]
MSRGHAFVLGSGVAGLSCAEVLSRNGWQITLFEAAPDLGGEASRSTQNWFHTGWLYAALPNKAAMVDCNQALRLFHAMYGGVLSPETLNLTFRDGSVEYPASDRGWFSGERVQYLYATGTAELSRGQRLFWKDYLRAVAFRRLRGLGYDVTPTTVLDPKLARLLDHWEASPVGRDLYTVVRSTDAQINTRRVLNSLLALLGERAEVVCGARYTLAKEGASTVIRMNGEVHRPDLVVLATGQGIAQQLTDLGCESMARRFKSVCSPIAVLKRALDLPNFIRFTPNLPTTINHIKYEIPGVGSRSTVGSYDYFQVGQAPDISSFAQRVCARLDIPTSDVANVYYGTKTEFTGSAERRYNHAIERVSDNAYFVIPGKFSQFPLLAHEFCQRLGLRSEIGNSARGVLRMEVAATAPELSFLDSQMRARTEQRAKPKWAAYALEG